LQMWSLTDWWIGLTHVEWFKQRGDILWQEVVASSLAMTQPSQSRDRYHNRQFTPTGTADFRPRRAGRLALTVIQPQIGSPAALTVVPCVTEATTENRCTEQWDCASDGFGLDLSLRP
jgi:hypothetical protein